jgi:hydroxyacylglutathione hydrolase
MLLEDHAGDVLAKSRVSANLQAADVARAAGLSVEDYTHWEKTGQCGGAPDYPALGRLLNLDGAKLGRLAKGWKPAAEDAARWRQLRMISTSGSGMTVNCFLVWDEATRAAALFDTGWDGAPALKLADEHGLDLKHLFITHSHTDHIAAIPDIRTRFPGVEVHSNSRNAPRTQHLAPGAEFSLGSLRVAWRDTPGHAEDGVTYVITGWPGNAPPVAVVGDAVFAGSIGGPKQFAVLAKRKIREQIFSLPPETLICPGHGPFTTVGQELANNPFFS